MIQENHPLQFDLAAWFIWASQIKVCANHHGTTKCRKSAADFRQLEEIRLLPI
jgi:hypothetical protein